MRFSSKLAIFLCFGFLFSATTIHLVEGDGEKDGENTEEPPPETDAKDESKAEVKEDEDVLVLTTKNFDSNIAKHEVILVEFYAPWCGHCKNLAPEYAKAAKELKANTPPVPLAKVDATVEHEVASRFKVTGYPTMRFFVKGKDYEYDGPRDAKGIVDYMKVRADPNWVPPKSPVIVLTKDNFTNWINEKDLSLVEFYAPWCGHCKQLEPDYEKSAAALLKNDPPIALAKVDATVETELAKEYKVEGFPSLKVFRKGRASEYTGPRDHPGIFDHMVKQVGEASKEVKTLKSLKAAFKKDDITVVGFFENEKDKEYEAYFDAANNLREDYKFVHTFESGLRDAYKVNAGSVVVFNAERFYTKYENKWHVFDKPETKQEDIQTFIKEHQNPLVGQLDYTNNNLRYKKRPLCLVFYTVDFSIEHRQATQLWRLKIADIAKDFRDITFAVADEDQMSAMWTDFKFDDSSEEINIGCLAEKDKKYAMEPMEDGFDADAVRNFIKKFKDGKLQPLLKSQPIPKKQGIVKTVVGKSFDALVNDKTKDVLIEFYAPWCGHCKKLEPAYAKMAKELASDKNLVIAKMDATNNDPPNPYDAEGFPTVYFAPSNNKENPVKFDGEANVKDLKEFMKKHATVSFGKGAKEEL